MKTYFSSVSYYFYCFNYVINLKSRILKALEILEKKVPTGPVLVNGDSLGIRTLDPLIKSQ